MSRRSGIVAAATGVMVAVSSPPAIGESSRPVITDTIGSTARDVDRCVSMPPGEYVSLDGSKFICPPANSSAGNTNPTFSPHFGAQKTPYGDAIEIGGQMDFGELFSLLVQGKASAKERMILALAGIRIGEDGRTIIVGGVSRVERDAGIVTGDKNYGGKLLTADSSLIRIQYTLDGSPGAHIFAQFMKTVGREKELGSTPFSSTTITREDYPLFEREISRTVKGENVTRWIGERLSKTDIGARILLMQNLEGEVTAGKVGGRTTWSMSGISHHSWGNFRLTVNGTSGAGSSWIAGVEKYVGKIANNDITAALGASGDGTVRFQIRMGKPSGPTTGISQIQLPQTVRETAQAFLNVPIPGRIDRLTRNRTESLSYNVIPKTPGEVAEVFVEGSNDGKSFILNFREIPGMSYMCSVDGKAEKICKSGEVIALTDLAPGEHTLSITPVNDQSVAGKSARGKSTIVKLVVAKDTPPETKDIEATVSGYDVSFGINTVNDADGVQSRTCFLNDVQLTPQDTVCKGVLAPGVENTIKIVTVVKRVFTNGGSEWINIVQEKKIRAADAVDAQEIVTLKGTPTYTELRDVVCKVTDADGVLPGTKCSIVDEAGKVVAGPFDMLQNGTITGLSPGTKLFLVIDGKVNRRTTTGELVSKPINERIPLTTLSASDAPPELIAPEAVSVGYTNATLKFKISDADGIRNRKCKIGSTTIDLDASGNCTFTGLTPGTTYPVKTTAEVARKNADNTITWVPVEVSTNFTTLIGSDSPTTVALTPSEVSFTSMKALCSLKDADGVTGNCTITKTDGTVVWTGSFQDAAQAVSGLTPGTPYTLNLSGTATFVGTDGSRRTDTVTRSASFTTLIGSDAPPELIAPEAVSVGYTNATLKFKISDADGIRNRKCKIGSTTIDLDASGNCTFTGLTPGTTYPVKTTAEVARKNADNTITWVPVEVSTNFKTLLDIPTVSFGSAYTATLGQSPYTRTLTTNSPGAVTYTSSNTNIATVDPNTGAVTFKATGNVNIIANQVASGNYGAATASYAITINAPQDAVTVIGGITCNTTSVVVGNSINCSITPQDSDGIFDVKAKVDGQYVTVTSAGGTYSVNLANLSIGSHSLIWEVTGKKPDGTAAAMVASNAQNLTITAAPDTTPDAYSITAINGAQRSTTVTSSAVTIAGINQPTTISVTGGLVSINGGSFVTSGTITNGQSFVVQLTTSSSYSTPSTATVNVGGVTANFVATTLANSAPTLGAISPISVTTGTAGSVTLPAGSDTAGDILTYSVTGLPTGFSFNPATRLLSWNTSTTVGTPTFTYTVTDQGNAAASQQVQVTITAAPDTTPDAYSITAINGAQRSTTVTSSAVTIAGINQPTTISVTGGLVSINGGSFVTSGTITNGQSFVVQLTTSSSYSTPSTATVNVGGVTANFVATTLANSAPTLGAISPISVTTGTAGSVTLPAGSDTAGDILTYSVTGLPTGFSFNPATRLLSWNTSTTVGTPTFTYTVTDQGNAASSQQVQVTITAAPDTTPDAYSITAINGAQRSTTVTSSAVTIAGINQPTTISVTGGLVSINGGSFVTSGTITNGQSFVVQLTTSSSYSTPSTATVNVGGVTANFVATTLANSAPTLGAISPISVTTGTAGSVTLPAGSDTAGDILTYSVTGLPTGFSFNPATRLLSWNTSTTVGTPTFTYTVTDQGNAASSQQVQVTITAAPDTTPDAYSITAINGAQRSTTVTSSAVTIAGINQPTTISVTGGLVSINGGSFVTSGTITNGQSFVVQLTTSSSYSTPSTATVNVGGVTANFVATTLANSAPTLGAISPISVTTGTAGSVTLPAGSDTAGDILTYSVTGLPTGFSFNPATRLLSWNTSTTVGTPTFTYTVTDQGNAAASQQVQVTITAAPDTTPPVLNVGSSNPIIVGSEGWIGGSSPRTGFYVFDDNITSVQVVFEKVSGNLDPTQGTVSATINSGNPKRIDISASAPGIWIGDGEVRLKFVITSAGGTTIFYGAQEFVN